MLTVKRGGGGGSMKGGCLASNAVGRLEIIEFTRDKYAYFNT